jgi:hypothetical protein
MASGVILGEQVGQVNVIRSPGDVEVALSHAVANLVKSHVHGFGAPLGDVIIRDCCCT